MPLPIDDNQQVNLWVVKAQHGDISSFNHLVETYFEMVFAIGYARLRNRESAEDLAQDVFLKVFLGLPHLNNPGLFSHWLVKITRNLAISMLRKESSFKRVITYLPMEILSETGGTSIRLQRTSEMEQNERYTTLKNALGQLSDEQREIVLLYYMNNLTLTQISEQLNVHRTTVSRHLDQALSHLRRYMDMDYHHSVTALKPSKSEVQGTLCLIPLLASLSKPAKARILQQTGGIPSLSLPEMTVSLSGPMAQCIDGIAKMGWGSLVLKIVLPVCSMVLLLGSGIYYGHQVGMTSFNHSLKTLSSIATVNNNLQTQGKTVIRPEEPKNHVYVLINTTLLSRYSMPTSDPWGNPYYINRTTVPQFYSLGPDKIDNHRITMYDPTNGASSHGDIFFNQ